MDRQLAPLYSPKGEGEATGMAMGMGMGVGGGAGAGDGDFREWASDVARCGDEEGEGGDRLDEAGVVTSTVRENMIDEMTE